MHLASISLKNFKRFHDPTPTVVPLTSRLTALVGPNRSGKTSVLQALAILGFISKNDRHEDTGDFFSGPSSRVEIAAREIAADLRQLISVGSQECKLDVFFSDSTSISTTISNPDGIANLHSDCKPNSHMLRVTYVPRDMSFPRQTDEDIHEPRVFETKAVCADGTLTAHYVAGIKAANKLATLDEIMEQIFPGVGNLDVASTKKVNRLRFRRAEFLTPWFKEGSGVSFVLTIFAAILYDQCTRFSSATNIAASAPFKYHHLVVLDEPASSLHPQVFPAFLDALLALDVQIVLATHSVDFLLRSVHITETSVQLVSLQEPVPELRPQVTEEILRSLGMSSELIREALPQHAQQLATLASLSAGKRILYLEGRNDIQALKVFMNMIDASRAARFHEKVIVEWTSTRKKVSEYVQNAGILASFLESWSASEESRSRSKVKNKKSGLRVAVLVDRDYRPERVIEFETTSFAAALLTKPLVAPSPDSIYLTWGQAAEWENYFMDKTALRSVLESMRPRVLGKLESTYQKYVQAGRGKLVKEFGTSVKEAQDAGDKMLATIDLGSVFAEMWVRYETDPSWGMDAKLLMKELGINEPRYWKALYEAIGRDAIPEIKDVVIKLFEWAGV